MFNLLDHFCGLHLDALKQLHIFPVLRKVLFLQPDAQASAMFLGEGPDTDVHRLQDEC